MGCAQILVIERPGLGPLKPLTTQATIMTDGNHNHSLQITCYVIIALTLPSVSDSASDSETIGDDRDEIEVEEEDSVLKDELDVKDVIPVEETNPDQVKEEKPVKRTGEEIENEPAPDLSDVDSNDIKSEQMELGDTLDDIINRIGDGEEEADKKVEKKEKVKVKVEALVVEEPVLSAEVLPIVKLEVR
jgi:hypothetical protein